MLAESRWLRTMNVKTILYVLAVPLVIWALDSININQIFKKNHYYQARLFYLIVTFSLSYLIVNFFYDFFMYSKFVWLDNIGQ